MMPMPDRPHRQPCDHLRRVTCYSPAGDVACHATLVDLDDTRPAGTGEQVEILIRSFPTARTVS